MLKPGETRITYSSNIRVDDIIAAARVLNTLLMSMKAEHPRYDKEYVISEDQIERLLYGLDTTMDKALRILNSGHESICKKDKIRFSTLGCSLFVTMYTMYHDRNGKEIEARISTMYGEKAMDKFLDGEVTLNDYYWLLHGERGLTDEQTV